MRLAFLVIAAVALTGCPSSKVAQPPNLFQDNCENWTCDQAGDCWCEPQADQEKKS